MGAGSKTGFWHIESDEAFEFCSFFFLGFILFQGILVAVLLLNCKIIVGIVIHGEDLVFDI